MNSRWLTKNRDFLAQMLSVVTVVATFLVFHIPRDEVTVGLGIVSLFILDFIYDRLIGFVLSHMAYISPLRDIDCVVPSHYIFSQHQINLCIDLFRTWSLDHQIKDPRYYQVNFLSRWFGYYKHPAYPLKESIHGLVDIWGGYGPRPCGFEEASTLLANCMVFLYGAKDYDSVLFLARARRIVEEQRRASESAEHRGIRYTFGDPFLQVATDIDNQLLRR